MMEINLFVFRTKNLYVIPKFNKNARKYKFSLKLNKMEKMEKTNFNSNPILTYKP